jgi:choline dehydrogenase-like flavoprotein
MAAPYELNDGSVVVVIGTGAGGGTLANELAQKGIDVVALEAGGRYLPDDYINGSTPAPPAATGGSPRTSPGCPPGSSRRSAARPFTGRARPCACKSTSSGC